jgi:hypothetical protein
MNNFQILNCENLALEPKKVRHAWYLTVADPNKKISHALTVSFPTGVDVRSKYTIYKSTNAVRLTYP